MPSHPGVKGRFLIQNSTSQSNFPQRKTRRRKLIHIFLKERGGTIISSGMSYDKKSPPPPPPFCVHNAVTHPLPTHLTPFSPSLPLL